MSKPQKITKCNKPCAPNAPTKYVKPTKEQKEQNEYFTMHASIVYSLLPIIQTDDRDMVRRWLDKLGGFNASQEERTIRNDFIWLLLVQLESGVVTLPFIKPPPKGKLRPVSEMLDKRVYMAMMEAANRRIKEAEPQIDLSAGAVNKIGRGERCQPSEFFNMLPKPKFGFIAYGSCFSDQLR